MDEARQFFFVLALAVVVKCPCWFGEIGGVDVKTYAIHDQ